MSERGFAPLVLVGAILTALAVAVVGSSVSIRHLRNTKFLEESTVLAAATRINMVKRSISSLLKWATAGALVEVSERAGDFPDGERIRAIENLAAKNFLEALEFFSSSLEEGVRLQLPAGPPTVKILEAENGQVKVVGELDGTIVYHSQDGSLKVKIPIEQVESFIDARFFTLQERMKSFMEGLGQVNTIWGMLEYAKGWGEALCLRKVRLDEGKSAELFRLAWAIHEYNTFGSFDYLGAVADFGEVTKDFISSNGLFTSQPDHSKLDALVETLERVKGEMREAMKELDEVVTELNLAEEHLKENSLENFSWHLERASERLRAAISSVSFGRQKFNDFLSQAFSAFTSDPFMEAVLSGISERKIDPAMPSPKEQVVWAMDGISQVLGDVRIWEGMGKEEISLAREKISEVTRDEGPVKWITVKGYAGTPPREVENRLPVYISERSGRTIPNLMRVLEGLSSDFSEVKQLCQGPSGSVDGELLRVLTISPVDFSADRENLYLLFPPQPIREEPGLSVFRELELGEVKFSRQDLAGLCGARSATPVYIPFANIILWWGGWEVKIKLNEGIEKIFDFKNPTILQLSSFGPVHAPLGYRWVLGQKEFKISVVVISPAYFEIF